MFSRDLMFIQVQRILIMVSVEFWGLITWIGSPYIWGYLMLVLLFIYPALEKGKAKRSIRSFLRLALPALIITFLLVQGIKYAVPLDRPCMPCSEGQITVGCNPYCLEDSTFPSGHASAAFAGFTVLGLLIRRRWFMLAYIFPLLVALSRVFLGVHTWMDILAGAAIGIAVPVMFKRFLEQPRVSKAL